VRKLTITVMIALAAGLCLLPVLAEAGSVAPSSIDHVVQPGGAAGILDRVTGQESQSQIQLAHWAGHCYWRKKCVAWRNGHCVKRRWMKHCPHQRSWFYR
jgi:hypothetical protein